MKSILQPVRQWAERCPDKLLFAFLDIDGRTTVSYSYAQFLQRSSDIASHLHRKHTLKPGARVLLAYPPGLEMICAFFASVRLGLIPVPVYPPDSHGFRAALHKMDFIARDCAASAVLTDRTCFWSMKLNLARHRVASGTLRREPVARLPWIVTTDADAGSDLEWRDAHSEILFLQYTSGSTSNPKGVMVSHENILHNCDTVVDHIPVGVSWLPQYHDMGLIGYYLFFAMKGGTTYGFSPLDFIQRPALWLETISRHHGTASSAPNFAYEYCLRPDKVSDELCATLNLSSLRFLMTAAEPVRANVYRDFLRRFAPCGLNPASFFCAYGLAENTLAVSNYGHAIKTFDQQALRRQVVKPAACSTHERAASTALVSCGKPLAVDDLKIIDITSTPREVGDGHAGEIWIRGPSTCLGYWNRPQLSTAIFGATLPASDDHHRWLRTGDVGFLHEGELYICGRDKDLIIVRGLNYYPQDIELLVEQDPAIRKGCVAAFGLERGGREQLVVTAELRNPAHLPDVHALQQRVLAGLGIAIDVMVYLRPRTLPKTSSGKIARHLAQRRYLEGTLEVVSELRPTPPGQATTAQPAIDKEQGTIARSGFEAVLETFGLTGTEPWTLLDAGLDSLNIVDLAQALKTHLTSQGHPELASAVDVRLLHSIAISELNELLRQLSLAAPLAKLHFRKALSQLGYEHRERELAMMKQDARLRFNPSHLPVYSDSQSTLPEGSLLTGGTGFFGPFLLASLLEQTSGPIYVLVRADSESSARQRLLEGLSTIQRPGIDLAIWSARIQPVCGDLGRVNLGLPSARWHELAGAVHTIYHNGALVNYLLDYASMRDVNVGGTNEVIRLAMSQRGKVFNHISTTFVFGWSVKSVLYERDNNADIDLLDFGYSQSKWVAEQVVFDAMQQGLKARIFRPALITPSLDGGGSNLDISIRLLAFMLNQRIGTSAQNQVSFSPAEFVSANIVAIAQQADSIGRTFHVTRDTYANMEEITGILGDLTGVKLTHYPLTDFVPEVIARCQPGDILFPLLEFFVRSADNIAAMEFKRYDNSLYRAARDTAAHGQADPPLGDVVLGILRFMRRQGLVNE